ncbi:MAG: hypothetical protein ACJ79M_12595 [Myxococcales bacterium]
MPLGDEQWIRWVDRRKHKPLPRHDRAQTIEDTRGDADSRYFPGIDVAAVEREAASHGTVVPSGKEATMYKVFRFDAPIGASQGAETDCVRVESTNGDFHGFPIAHGRYIAYLRKAERGDGR